MSDQSKDPDPGRIWRDQPEERVPVNRAQIVNRRTEELSFRTRADAHQSLGAALLLLGVASWRLPIAHDGLLKAGLAAAAAWVILSLFFFRRRIQRPVNSSRDARAASCLEYYRQELERRRDHLRNAWLWHGPLLLAALVLIAVLAGRANISFQPLRNVLPLLILLVAWVGFGIWRRLLQARSLQQEIDELRSRT